MDDDPEVPEEQQPKEKKEKDKKDWVAHRFQPAIDLPNLCAIEEKKNKKEKKDGKAGADTLACNCCCLQMSQSVSV